MGEEMAKPKTKIYEIVALIEKHGPISPNALTDMTGDFRQSVDKYIRLAHKANLIHIDSFGPSPLGGNRTVKLYACGKGIDAERVYYRDRKHAESGEKIRAKRSSLTKCRRDPMVTALFGAAI